MKIAVEGCAHGELNKIYECIKHIEIRENIKVDLLICCGDFQSVRDKNDMASMAVPEKYMEMKDFCEYYSGQKVAPVLTLFIGGNHEASTYLWELPYGGWVAENIYYLGFSGVLDFAGIRIGGVSGIYKKRDYLKDHFEMPPFNQDTKRSFYHVRKRDIEKMKLLQSDPPDVVLSHDWPTNIYNHGDKEQLVRFKPFLKDEIEDGTLGNEGAEELLNHIQPSYWFSGHMHAKFAALVEHPNGKKTKFLALDKCLPKRKFLQILDIGEEKGDAILKYDAYWLGILKMTNGLTRFQELSEDHKPNKEMLNQLNCSDLDVIPFSKSIDGENLQTSSFCEKYNLKNPCKAQSWKSIKSTVKNSVKDTNEDKMNFKECSTTPKAKMILPKPGTGDTTIKSTTSKKKAHDDDEFGEICNPNSSNLDSDNSDSDSNSSTGSGSGSSSGSSDEDNNSGSDDDSDVGDSKVDKRDPPSFIETPLCAKTPNYKSATTPFSSTSTPFKSKTGADKLQNKALSFLDTSSCEKVSDEGKTKMTDAQNSGLQEKVAHSKASINDVSSRIDSSILNDDSISRVGGKTAEGDNEISQTPVKKFKLVRRNQNIYTPTKEDD